MRLIDSSHRPVSWPWAATAGVLAAAVGLGIGELVASLTRSLSSPVISIGNRVVDAVPQPIKQLAIDLFGTNDKIALIVGILTILAVLAAGLGILARSRPLLAAGGTALLGLAGVASAAVQPGADLPVALLPSLATTAVAVPLLLLLVRPTSSSSSSATETAAEGEVSSTRRRFLQLAGWSVAAGVGAATLGRVLAGRFDVMAERQALTLPAPGTFAPPVPEGAHPSVDGLSPFITPNDDFYRIDTQLTVPQLSADGWTLRIHGMVEEERTFSYRELLDMASLDVPITLTCVSNEVGGDLVGTARWQGVLLADLLEAVGVDPEATQIVGRAFDGFTTGMPAEVAGDRDTLVAYGMNGEPLSPTHGFPLRLVTPGLYGYVSATKWLTEIELTTFEAFDQYWVERDWDEMAPVKTQSRIDTPGGFGNITAGDTVPVAGVAWAQTRGIESVEVRVDDGEWQQAELAEAVSNITWRQWVWRWDTSQVAGGRHQLTVRATDGSGEVQTDERARPFPNGASGWHSVAVFVEE